MPDSSFDIADLGVVFVPTGTYEIGSDEIPNASPVHLKDIQGFWIDAAPMTYAHFEKFVAAGGYFHEGFWTDSHFHGNNALTTRSIDAHCEKLFGISSEFARQAKTQRAGSSHLPLIGLTWMEAAAVCRFFNSRLPFEREWEVAMQRGPTIRHPSVARVWDSFHSSTWGCKITSGLLQEWTANAFASKYWRVDRNKETPFYCAKTNTEGVTLRGASPHDLYQDTRFRQYGLPSDREPFRSCRRVWNSEPSLEQTSFNFIS